MKPICFIALLAIAACSTDKENLNGNTLEDDLAGEAPIRDNVIACAASNENDDLISVFLYPRDGATELRYYETIDAQTDKGNFREYYQLEPPLLDVFNGYLKKFEISASEEKWVIVSFKEDGKTHLSNPIRLKQNAKPTEYLPQNIAIDSTDATMPKFTWEDGAFEDTKIYFQVLSAANNDLISGTYTFEKEFQFYDLDNVVLNITKGMPSALKQGESHRFTLLAVSEDNWVNLWGEVAF
ncbi:MAG: hypothetical protein WBG48_19535 [Pricia sp.]